MRLGEAFSWARARIGAVDARALLHHASGMSHAVQQAHPEVELTASQVAQFKDSVIRREAGEPVAYLTGWREFYGCEFRVSKAVLIPRPETEHLVDIARESLTDLPAPRVLDLGTGSGVLAITLARLCPGANVVAVDASIEALKVAQDNAHRLGVRVRFLQGDWFSPVAGEKFDLIVSNPPYIAAQDAHLGQGDLRFEPPSALTDGSADGLMSLREIITHAPAHLALGGWLWLEHGFDQAAACAQLLEAAGFQAVRSLPDLAGHLRVSGARLGNRAPSKT